MGNVESLFTLRRAGRRPLMSKCRLCAAPIDWGVTLAGKRVPLDRITQHLYVGMHEEFPFGTNNFLIQPIRIVFQSHFLSCPKANEAKANAQEKQHEQNPGLPGIK